MNKTSDKIGVLMGGLSEEREVSLNSGRALADALDQTGHNVVRIDVDRDLPATLKREGITKAVLALHGPMGEDGTVQGLLELMGIPYSGPGVTASAICMDKVLSKRLFRDGGLHTPDWWDFNADKGDDANTIIATLSQEKPPWFLKPINSGSSVGVTRIDDHAALPQAIADAFKVSPRIMVETEVNGAELACAVLDGQPLPLIEIRPTSGFYDYKNKYTAGRTNYLMPPPDLSQALLEKAATTGVAAYELTGCRGLSRVDILMDDDGIPWVLEVNTIPGMTATSLAPKAAQAAGLTFEALAERILAGAALG